MATLGNDTIRPTPDPVFSCNEPVELELVTTRTDMGVDRGGDRGDTSPQNLE